MNLQEASRHFAADPSDELRVFVDDDVLLDSRYLFYQVAPVTKSLMAYCTHCKHEYRSKDSLKHNRPTICESCGSIVIAKQSFRGRGKMLDKAYVEFAETSLIDPEVLIVSGYYVYRDYREDYKDVETGFIRLAMYVFKPKESHMWKRSKWDDVTRIDSFIKSSSIYSLGRSHMTNTLSYLSRDSFNAAVQGTPFQYCEWQQYGSERLLEYFELASKYPIVEVLTKIGLREVIGPYLNKKPKAATFKWKAKSLDKIIGLPKTDWKQIKHLPKPISSEQLYVLQQLRETGETIPFLELYNICNKLNIWYSLGTFKMVQLSSGASIRKIFNYVQKQFELEKDHYRTCGQALITWNDYLSECHRTRVNLKDPQNMYPKNVHQLHQAQIERKKAIADMKLNLKIRKRAKDLANFTFNTSDLLIRPIKNATELAEESNQLVHCVSTYANRYAKGETNLFVIRKMNELDKPYYTVEIKDNQIIQVRGYKNCAETKEVDTFVKRFKKEVLQQEESMQSA